MKSSRQDKRPSNGNMALAKASHKKLTYAHLADLLQRSVVASRSQSSVQAASLKSGIEMNIVASKTSESKSSMMTVTPATTEMKMDNNSNIGFSSTASSKSPQPINGSGITLNPQKPAELQYESFPRSRALSPGPRTDLYLEEDSFLKVRGIYPRK